MPAANTATSATGQQSDQASQWTVFWRRPAAIPAPERLPAAVDVLVVGGGISGVSLLRHLAQRNLKALLVERRHLAFGASGRNAGFLLAGTSDNYADAVRRYGKALAAEVWAFTDENHDRLAEALAGRAGYARRGSDILAASKAEAEQLEASAQLLSEAGLEVGYREGRLTNPRDGELDPAAAVAALASDCPPGSIVEGREVTSLEELPVRADATVLCTNAYTPGLLALPIEPRRAQILATAPESARVADRPVYSDHGYRYWRQLRSGEVLCGGWRNLAFEAETGYSLETNPRLQAAIERHLREIGVQAPVSHRWAGTMGFTPDGLPLVGAAREAVYVMAGFNGHGLAFAFNCARLLAEHLAGGAPPPSWLESARHSR